MNERVNAMTGAFVICMSVALLDVGAIHPAAAATVVTSGGYDVFASLLQSNGYGMGGVYGQIGEVDALADTAPGPYDAVRSLPSFQGAANLGPYVITITTGPETAAVSSPYRPTPTGMAAFSIDSLSMVLGPPSGPPILEISATTISGTTSASAVGGLSTTGSSTLEDLSLSGTLIGAPISLPGLVAPPANDVLFDKGGTEIIANYQGGYDTGTDIGQTTIPLDVFIGGSAAGGVSGLVNFGFNAAAVSTAPEPAVWFEILVGVGLTGAALRRRRAPAAA